MLGFDVDPTHLITRATGLLERAETAGRRGVLGIAGAPAGGKSTLTDWLVSELSRRRPGQIAHLGMDAFHLANGVLDRHGLRAVKGAPQTFDALGYLAVLQRIRDEPTATVFAPVFHREIEESIAHETEIGASVRLVITEGNYLLLGRDPWTRVAGLLDEVWFVELAEDVRQQRLVARHRSYGLGESQARERAYGSDLANAELIRPTRASADLVISARVPS